MAAAARDPDPERGARVGRCRYIALQAGSRTPRSPSPAHCFRHCFRHRAAGILNPASGNKHRAHLERRQELERPQRAQDGGNGAGSEGAPEEAAAAGADAHGADCRAPPSAASGLPEFLVWAVPPELDDGEIDAALQALPGERQLDGFRPAGEVAPHNAGAPRCALAPAHEGRKRRERRMCCGW